MADALAEYERNIAGARTSAFKLGLSLLAAQNQRALSPIVGRQIFAAVTTSQSGLDAALSGSAEAHRLVEALARRLGLDVSGYGAQKPPEPSFFTSAREDHPDVIG